MVATLACVVLCLGVGLAQTVVTASSNVPFDFWAQGRKFPAGDYVFDSRFPGSISILDQASKLNMAVAAGPMRIAEFEHRGEKNNEQREVRLVYP